MNQNALAQFQKATEIDQTYAMAYTHMAWVYYFRMYAWEKAASAFERALELGQGKFSATLQAELNTELGWSYYRLGRCADARTVLDKAITLLSKYPAPGTAAISQQANDGIAACQGKK